MQNPLDINIHWLDLSGHGATPGGLPLYRVVWADSRKTVIYEGDVKQEFGRYEDQAPLCGKWILEKWLTPYQLTRMTPEEYQQFFSRLHHKKPEIGDQQFDAIHKDFGISEEFFSDIVGTLDQHVPMEPYPSEGDYEAVLVVDPNEPAKVRLLIDKMEHRLRTMTLEQRQQEVKDEFAAKQEAIKQEKHVAIREMFDADVQPEKTGVIYG